METQNVNNFAQKRVDPRDSKGSYLRFLAKLQTSTPAARLHSTRTLPLRFSQSEMGQSLQQHQQIVPNQQVHSQTVNSSFQKNGGRSMNKISSKVAAKSTLAKYAAMKMAQSSNLFIRRLQVINSRVAGNQKLLILPLLMFTNAAYGYYSLRQMHYHTAVNKNESVSQPPVESHTSLKQKILSNISGQIVDIVASEEVRKQGLSYLERMFKHAKVHESLIYLLKNDIKDPRFIEASKHYGIDLIQHAVQTTQVQQASKGLVVDTFTKDKRVIQKSTEMLKYFVQHPESREITKVFMKNCLLRQEVLDVMAQQTTIAGIEGFQSQQFQNGFNKTVLQVMSRDDIQQSIKSSLVYKPLTNLLTFGLYSLIASESDGLTINQTRPQVALQ